MADIGALRSRPGPYSRVPVPCYIGEPGGPFMRATRLVSLVVPLLVVPGLAAAQSRYFTYERGIDRPGHAYRFLETHNAADCSLACQAVHDANAREFQRDVDSCIVFHGCPPSQMPGADSTS